MKQTITRGQFIDQFKTIRPGNFSYAGLNALFDYLEEWEECQEELELDVIAICCDFTEWADLEEFNRAYDLHCEYMMDVEEHTVVIEIDAEAFITMEF
jgi:phage tail tube protein FII